MQSEAQETKTLAILKAQIELSQRDFDALCQLYSIEPTDKRRERLQVVSGNLGQLKARRLNYMAELRWRNLYREALDTDRWQGEPISERKRAELETWISKCQSALAKIDREVGG